MPSDNDDYKVGYKRPPRRHQYRQGQSGNPKGRPKKPKLGIAELIDKYLETPIAIMENGRRRVVTAAEAIVRRLLHDGATGEPRALELILLLHQKTMLPPEEHMPCFEIHFVDGTGKLVQED